MKKRKAIFFLLAIIAASFDCANAIELYDWAFNIDGTIYQSTSAYSQPDEGQLPSILFDDTLFDWSAGIGDISISFTAETSGEFFISSFFDYEIDEQVNTYFNEYGEVFATPSTNQSWEIDEPGWVMGDIYDNFLDGTLDNTNAITSGTPDDVSMALGWNLFLEEGQTAIINFYISEILPSAEFYLAHTDPDSDVSIYFYSDVEIVGGVSSVPEPATITLLGIGVLGIAGGRKITKKKS